MALFDSLTDKLGGIFDGLTGRGALSEKDVEAVLSGMTPGQREGLLKDQSARLNEVISAFRIAN